MSENKFIKHLRGENTAKSVLEIKNQRTTTSFANMPNGTSNANDVYSDHRGNATIVANGTLLWKVDGETLESVESVFGDGKDFLSVQSVAGSGLWVNASYTFPSTGDPNHPIAMVFNPNTKWVLKLCGDNLIVDGGNVVDFTLIVKIGSAHIFSKNFKVVENAGQFSKEFILDFEETNTGIVKAGGLAKLTLQLLCGTENASARIYNGMTVLTCLQRKVDASAVSSTNANVQDVLDGNIIPDDYFSNPAFIDQIEDGKDAYAVFNRDGDSVILSGWTPKEDVATATQLNTETQNRISADDALGLRIDSEATARESADNALGTRIDNVINDLATETTAREKADTALQGQITSNKNAIDAHVADTSNPHSVTKAQVGLGNVDNTSDLDKPISTATQAALDGKMSASVKYGAALSLTINSTTYVVTAQLKDQDGNNLGMAQTIDLPLESVVVSGAYDSATKEVVLTLQDGSTIRFSVADLVSGLQTEITALNMLSADLVDDTNTTHKFVTTTEKTTWDGKQDAISDLATIRSNAQAGKVASDTIATYGNIVTHNVSEFATSAQGAKADTAVQPSDLGNGTITITQGGITKGTFTTNQSSNTTVELDAGGGSSVVIDNSTITRNADQEIQASAVVNQNSGVLKSWTGTLAQYTALETKSDDTQYIITDDDSAGTNVYTKAEVDSLVNNALANADYVIAFQAPTAENNYTWYRKYKSGWVEQGGCLLNAATGAHTITIPVEMASVEELKKSAITTPIFINDTIRDQGVSVRNSNDSFWSTTQIDCYSWGATIHIKWQVSGMAA